MKLAVGEVLSTHNTATQGARTIQNQGQQGTRPSQSKAKLDPVANAKGGDGKGGQAIKTITDENTQLKLTV